MPPRCCRRSGSTRTRCSRDAQNQHQPAQGDRARHHRLPGGAAVDAVRAVRRQLPLPDPRRPRARPAAAVSSYGNALLDRAVMDAVCRIVGASFWTAMRSNLAGMAAHPLIRTWPPSISPPSSPTSSRCAASPPGTRSGWSTRSSPPIRRGHSGRRRPARDARGSGRRLRPALLQAKVGGDRQADIERLVKIAGVLDTVPEGAARHPRRQRAVRGRRRGRRPLGSDGGRAGAAEALRRPSSSSSRSSARWRCRAASPRWRGTGR